MYVLIEGIDGCGKDTQGDRLTQRLGQQGKVLRVNEPDDTLETGKFLRHCLKSGIEPEAHANLFVGNRMSLQMRRVRPALNAGAHVISVRSFISTLVYQQENWPLDWLLDIHRQLPCKATHAIILDLDPEVALQRATRRPGHMEFYEKLEIQQRNRQRYLDLAAIIPQFLETGGKVGVIDALGTPDEVEARIAEWLGV